MKSKKQFIKWLLRALFIINKKDQFYRFNPFTILFVFILGFILLFPQVYQAIKEIND